VRKTARDSTDLEKILIERAQKEKTLEQIRQLIVVYLLLRGGSCFEYWRFKRDSNLRKNKPDSEYRIYNMNIPI